MQTLVDESVSLAEVLRKVGLVDRGGNYATLKKLIDKYGINLVKLNKNRSIAYSEKAKELRASSKPFGVDKIPLEDILSGKREYVSSNNLRERLISEGYKERKCEICGLTEWMGLPIPL